jgi:tellurite resistance protein TehA-like permease
MKIKGSILIILGILGAIFVSTFDILTGKPVNDISGPKSIPALIFCGILIIIGIHFLLKSKKSSQERKV